MQFGRYRVIAFTVKYMRKVKGEAPKVNKKGELKPVMTAMFHRHIYFQVIENAQGFSIDDGMVWRFTSTRRGRWSDSRDKSQETAAKPKSLTDADVKAEITRMTGSDFANQVITALQTEIDKTEYAESIGASLIPYADFDEETGEEFERTFMEGGLLARIEAQTVKSKSNHTLSKVVNK